MYHTASELRHSLSVILSPLHSSTRVLTLVLVINGFIRDESFVWEFHVPVVPYEDLDAQLAA